MASDYTRTIVFKVEDQAIKRATGQIVASLKKIEKSLEKIEKKAFTQLVTDSGQVASNIDKAAKALNKYNSELRKAQTQARLPSGVRGGDLATREPGGALARTGGGSKRGRIPWGAVRGFGNLAGVGGTAIAASTFAINQANKQWNTVIGTINKATSIIPGVGDKFHIVESKVNGLSISLHALGQVMKAHPLLALGTAALIFGVGVNVKDVTTAVWGLKNGFEGATKGIYGLGRATRKVLTDLNPLDAVLSRVSGKFSTRVSGSYGGPVNQGFVSGKGYGLGLRQFLKPAKDATVDVFDIGKRAAYKKNDYLFGDLPYVDREAAERQRFGDLMRSRGLDPAQKIGMEERIAQNVESSRMSRGSSGFANWARDTSGRKRANKFLTEREQILRAIEKRNIKLKRQGLSEIKIADALNKKAKERLGITEDQGELSYGERRSRMFSPSARRGRRGRARQRMNERKQNRFSQRTGMDPKQAENLMLGFGFPMLFGGGVGAVGGGVGGAALGNMMGMPGFGLQILGSSLGTQLELLHSRVVSIGNATQTLNLDKLEESGIRVNAQLELQINRLKKVGKFAEAEQVLNRQVARTTGGFGTVNRDIANNVAMLTNVWDSLLAAVGTTLGMLAAPFITALAGILKLVQMLVVGVNVILSSIAWIIKKVGEGLFPSRIKDIEKAMANMNGALDEMAVKWGTWTDKMKEDRDAILEKIELGDKEALIQADIRAAVAEQGIEKQKQIEYAVRVLHATRDQYDEVKRVREAYKAIGATIKNGIVDSLEAAIMKTKSLGEIASNVFRMMASQLLKMGVNSALTGMFGGTGFGNFLGLGSKITSKSGIEESVLNNIYVDPLSDEFGQLYPAEDALAAGGPVKGGSSYLVGEKGPELFVPGSSGNIIPNHAMGGSNVVINVDASGSSVEGDAGQAEQLGSMLAAAVQAEIANQQRPGGLLANR